MTFFRPVVLFACLYSCLGATSARGDAIDVELMNNSRQIVSALHERHYRNVAVLPFRVQKSGERPTFHAGLINQNLPERVGNAIILGMRSGEPLIALCTDPVEVIENELGATGYRTQADRARLFGPTYPVITGGRRHLDAFLTGKVVLDESRSQVRVEIEAFGATNPGLVEDVCTFTCALDDFVLTDSSIGFAHSDGRRVLTRSLSDDDIVAGPSNGSASPRRPLAPLRSSTLSDASPLSIVDFKIMYDKRSGLDSTFRRSVRR